MNNITKILTIVGTIIIVAISFLNCDRVNDKEQIEQLKGKTVETLIIGSNSFVLDAYLWRDGMPGNKQNGMISINWLINTDSTMIPNNISMVKQYVIYKDKIWEATYENEEPTPSLPEYKMERVSRNGPKWDTWIYVDVISQIYDSQSNKDYYVEQKNVLVDRTR